MVLQERLIPHCSPHRRSAWKPNSRSGTLH
ncbi:hypothetical protein PDIG_31430 [Penicillium digitatum PHI26]|uniref:Uncharacterized protein n=2 Tax=Penicillium digitatum TaxID=36651 RepID=K9FY86_PEND2|nr:hypothetical protein PDIP_51010 [Penicillium digitatum Pd1]EKV12916.1 hypothetical protein PDIP_51010 [Penicillium digitatum Pd1]EKV14690.1 hypothetical protein PDIG_31430 [Penicillium digitatum PHI26]